MEIAASIFLVTMSVCSVFLTAMLLTSWGKK